MMTPIVLWYESVTSTNDVMKSMDFPPDAVAAYTQTGGHGRLGRSFASPEGGLYMSVFIMGRPEELSACAITARAAVAVRRAIADVAGNRADGIGIKWVNDLYLDGRKICGILTQNHRYGVIVGIGINWDTPRESFPKSLRNKAGSVFGEVRGREEKEQLAATVVAKMREVMLDPTWLDEYRRHDILTGKRIVATSLDKVVAEGTADGIDGSGALRVLTAEGSVLLSTGEVSVAFEKDGV